MEIFTPRGKKTVMITLKSEDSGVVLFLPNGDRVEIVISDNPEHDGYPYDIRVATAPVDGAKIIYPKL